MNTVFIFPGQGSQVVGMGKDLYNNFAKAKEVFEQVNNALGQNLTDIIFEGPAEELMRTENTQPALMAMSMALIEVMKHETKRSINDLCDIVAGHSVGEYSALCASGAITITDAAKILRIRGNAMQNSCEAGSGAMAACLGLKIDVVEAIAADACVHGICDIANDNTESQIVISGSLAAIDFACSKIGEAGGKAIKLNVSGPFHSRLMLHAEKVMEESINSMTMSKPLVPVVLNVTAMKSLDLVEIKSSLIRQVSQRVRWRETINYLSDMRVKNIVEIGSGKVLTNMLKKLNHDFTLTNIGNIAELESFLK